MNDETAKIAGIGIFGALVALIAWLGNRATNKPNPAPAPAPVTPPTSPLAPGPVVPAPVIVPPVAMPVVPVPVVVPPVAPVPPIVTPLPATPWKLIMDANFSSGMPSSLYSHAIDIDSAGSSRNRATMKPLPWNLARQGVRLEIVPGDRWNGTNYPRAEMMIQEGMNSVEYGVEYAFELTAAFDGQVSNPSEMLAVWQIHHDGGGTIPMAMYFKDGGLKLAVRPNVNSAKWYSVLSSLEEHRRYTFRIELKGDKGTGGYVRVLVDGVLRCEHVGQVGYTDMGRVGYPKFGLYDYWKTISQGLGMTTDGMKWFKKGSV